MTKEFLTVLEKVVNIVETIKQRNAIQMKEIKDEIAQFSDSINAITESKTAASQQEVMQYGRSEIAKMRKEFDAKMKAIDDKIETVRDGEDGMDANEPAIIAAITKQIEIPAADLRAQIPTIAVPIRDVLETLKGNERLDYTAVKGIVGIHIGATAPEDKKMLWIQA